VCVVILLILIMIILIICILMTNIIININCVWSNINDTMIILMKW